MKVCSRCKIEKERREFNKQQSHKDGFASVCRACAWLLRQPYDMSHREENNKRVKQYYVTHRKERREYNRQYQSIHKVEILKQKKQYNFEHKEVISQKNRL